MVRTDAHELIEAANAEVGNAEHYCADVLAAVFPRGRLMPTEEIQAAVRTKLFDLVVSVEWALFGEEVDGEAGRSWDSLTRSGVMQNPALIAFALARIAEDRLIKQLESLDPASFLATLPARLLGSGLENIESLSQQLLSAEQSRRQPRFMLYSDLKPDTLSQLIEQVAAVLLKDSLLGAGSHKDSVRKLLFAHDENSRLASLSRKLLFAIGTNYEHEIRDPRLCGLHLFVSGLARDFGIGHDLALRLIDGPSLSPLAILLSARAETIDTALQIIAALRGASRDDHALPALLDQYPKLEQQAAIRLVKSWNLSDGETG